MVEGGRVNRISVAVLVDGIYGKNEKGEPIHEERPKEQLHLIAALVRSAVGFDTKRGDQIEAVNLRFSCSSPRSNSNSNRMTSFRACIVAEIEPTDTGTRLRRNDRCRGRNYRPVEGQGRTLVVQRAESVDCGDHNHQLDGPGGLFIHSYAAGRRPGLQLGRTMERNGRTGPTRSASQPWM